MESINFLQTRKSKKRVEKLAKITFILASIIILVSYGPSVWYFLQGSEKLSEVIGRKFVNTTPSVASPVKELYQPRFDPSLSRDSKISIPAIGVDSKIVEATYENYEEVLKKGIWRVPDFGTPFDRKSPTILAAHRFGYLAWTNIFRKKNSFFNLPKLEEGDTVEVIWRQRKYYFEVYKTGKGEEIEDYSADLILYTCEDMGSSIRIFKYARLLEV
jgi:sortase (surface protein transpeptidase)